MAFKATTKDKVSVVWDFGDQYTFQGKADHYSWSPANLLLYTGCPNPVPRPNSSIKFTLNTKSFFGCTATDSIIITVKQPFKIKASLHDAICVGNSLNLFASGAELYTWTPANGLDDTPSPRPKAKSVLSTTYQVVGTDAANGFSDTAFVPFIVYRYPTVNAGDKTILVGETALNLTVFADVKSIKLQPPAGLTRTTCAAPIANPNQTATYTIAVTNQGRCLTKDEITVFVVCKEGNLFSPNTSSPNGDRITDEFCPRGKEVLRRRALRYSIAGAKQRMNGLISRQMTARVDSTEREI